MANWRLPSFPLQVRLVSSTAQVAGSDDILKTFLLACESKNTKLSVMGLVGMEKLIAHDAVAPSALPSILATLKEVSILYQNRGSSAFSLLVPFAPSFHHICVINYIWNWFLFKSFLQLIVTHLCSIVLQHADMSDEIVQLKTLQTALTILQSQLYPKDEVRGLTSCGNYPAYESNIHRE